MQNFGNTRINSPEKETQVLHHLNCLLHTANIMVFITRLITYICTTTEPTPYIQRNVCVCNQVCTGKVRAHIYTQHTYILERNLAYALIYGCKTLKRSSLKTCFLTNSQEWHFQKQNGMERATARRGLLRSFEF